MGVTPLGRDPPGRLLCPPKHPSLRFAVQRILWSAIVGCYATPFPRGTKARNEIRWRVTPLVQWASQHCYSASLPTRLSSTIFHSELSSMGAPEQASSGTTSVYVQFLANSLRSRRITSVYVIDLDRRLNRNLLLLLTCRQFLSRHPREHHDRTSIPLNERRQLRRVRPDRRSPGPNRPPKPRRPPASRC